MKKRKPDFAKGIGAVPKAKKILTEAVRIFFGGESRSCGKPGD